MYTTDFKLKLCKIMKTEEKSGAEIEHEYGVASSTVRGWYKKYELYGEDAFRKTPSELQDMTAQKQKQRIYELERQLADRNEELEIIKKRWPSLQRINETSVCLHAET